MMRVGLLRIDVHIPKSLSLKAKRMVLRSLKDRIRRNFNVSVCEVDNHQKWQLATFGIASVSTAKKHVDATLNKIRDFIEKDRDIIIVDYQIEII